MDKMNLVNKVVLVDGREFVCESGNGCNPEAMGTKIFGYWKAQGPGANGQIRRDDIQRVLGDAPVLPEKPKVSQPKPTMKDKVVEQVNAGQFPDIEVSLWSDMERFSNGHAHMGYQLATYGNGKEGGTIVAGGNEITVTVNGRTWGINLGTLVELVQAADAQREARLQR